MNNMNPSAADFSMDGEPLVPTSPADLFFEMKDPRGRPGVVINSYGEAVGIGRSPGWVVWNRKANGIFGEEEDWIFDLQEDAQRLANYLNEAARPRRIRC